MGVLNLAAAVVVLVLAWTVVPAGFMRILFTLFAVNGLAAAWETWQFFHRPADEPGWWRYHHFGGMIGSGIAAHTAFGAFGVRRLFPEWQLGALGLVPWLAPSIIGAVAIFLLTPHYRTRSPATADPTRRSDAYGGARGPSLRA